MNRIILLLSILLVFSNKILGQINLVPNPSFEDIINCPDGITAGQLNLAVPWINPLGTPDIYNSCSPYDLAGLPTNAVNCYQPALTGNGYAAIATYYTIPRTTEYMEVKLTEKLKKNKKYFISFYVSPRNCADFEICYSDGMGLAFSDTLYHEELIFGAEQIPPFIPAIQNPVGNMLKDTLNWIGISGCYTAKGTEEYAIIGNFRSSANTQNEGCIGATGSYLYIDDVGVYEYDPLPDTILLCVGESKAIGKPFLNSTYWWSTGDTNSIVTIHEEGQYIRRTMIGNCVLNDTIIALEIDKLLDTLPSDTLLCKGDVLEIGIPIIGDYLWSNGEASNQVSISEGGVYTVNIENDCGIFNHSFEVASEICACNVYVPTVFSPNNDGKNDFLNCFVICDFPFRATRFQVFNRWGNLVYLNDSEDNQSINWDGMFKGNALDIGVYCWVFEYEYTRNGILNKKNVSGNVCIIR